MRDYKKLKAKYSLLFALMFFMLIALPMSVSAVTITNVSLTMPEPVAGQTIKNNAVSANPELYKVTSYSWEKCSSSTCDSSSVVMAYSDTFIAGQTYKVRLGVFATEGNTMSYHYTCTHTTATVNGKSTKLVACGTASISLEIIFTVPYTYTITPSSNYTFPAKTVGYSIPDGYNFKVQNTSSEMITISANISGAGASAFNMKSDLVNINNLYLGPNNDVTFTITPKTGLSPGTYSATLTVSGANVVSKSFNISFTVNPVPATTYTITVQNDGNGTASASKSSATTGDIITLTAIANDGYMFKKWDVISGGVPVMGSEFTMGTSNVIVKALFEKIPNSGEIPVPDNNDPDIIRDDGKNEPIVAASRKDCNWLWIPFCISVIVAIGSGIVFVLMRKKEKEKTKNINEEEKK